MRTAMKNLAAVAAVITALSLAPAGASAFTGDGDGPHAGGAHFKRMATALGLSAQQKQDIKAIFQNNRPQIQPLVKQLVAERKALRTLIHADTVDETAIRAQSAKVAAIQADMAVQHALTGQAVRKLLTPEQVQKLKEFQAKMELRHEKVRARAMKQIDRDK
jgi:protein CpxP